MKTVTWKQGNETYTLGSGLGNWALSYEKRVKKGDVRLINGVLMSAYTVETFPWWTPFISYVCWTPVDETFNTYGNLREWKSK